MDKQWQHDDSIPRGLYEKYIVRRTDGSSEPGGKHENCQYFVLDLNHDKHAKAAIEVYAISCQDENPQLARDLIKIVESKT